MPPSSPFRTIAIAGLVAGTLDITDAMVFYFIRNQVQPIRILQSVASGLLGKAAFAGGWRTALLGLAMHFAIALFWAAVFVLVARALPVLRRYAIPCGLLYGLLVYVLMTYVVLPHTHAAQGSGHTPAAVLVNAVSAIVFCIGLPIALINRRLTQP